METILTQFNTSFIWFNVKRNIILKQQKRLTKVKKNWQILNAFLNSYYIFKLIVEPFTIFGIITTLSY